MHSDRKHFNLYGFGFTLECSAWPSKSDMAAAVVHYRRILRREFPDQRSAAYLFSALADHHQFATGLPDHMAMALRNAAIAAGGHLPTKTPDNATTYARTLRLVVRELVI